MQTKERQINFAKHDTYELGDTHLTLHMIANAVGVGVYVVQKHLKSGQLASCCKVRVLGVQGGLIAVEYDAALHHFLTRGRPWNAAQRAYTRQCKAQALRAKGWTVHDIAHALDVARETVNKYLDNHYAKPSLRHNQTPPWQLTAREHGLWRVGLG